MRRMADIAATSLILTSGLASMASGQDFRPRGQVLAPSGAPVIGALIRVEATGDTASSSADGRFVWPGPSSGQWAVTVRAIGFAPAALTVSVGPVGLSPFRITLTPRAQQLDSIAVRAATDVPARLEEFERRRKNGGGRFFTRDDIERAPGAQLVSSLLRVLPAGVRVVDSMGVPVAISTRGSKLVRDEGAFYVVPCVLRTVIDGQLQPWGTSLDIINPHEIAAVEVYLGAASIPSEFAAGLRDQFCGLLVFWTRSG